MAKMPKRMTHPKIYSGNRTNRNNITKPKANNCWWLKGKKKKRKKKK